MLRIVAKGMTFERQKTFVFNIASATEAKEEIKFEESIKEADKQENTEEHVQTETGEDKSNEVSWTSIIVRFVILNIVICIAGFIYFKRKNIKNLDIKKLSDCRKLLSLISISSITDFIRRRKAGENPEEELDDATPEAAPRQEAINREVPEIQKEQESETEPAPEATHEEAESSHEDQKNEISLDDIEPEQKETQAEAPEQGDEHQNEISLDDVEPGQEETKGETPDNQQEEKIELPPDSAELLQDTKEGEPGSV